MGRPSARRRHGRHGVTRRARARARAGGGAAADGDGRRRRVARDCGRRAAARAARRRRRRRALLRRRRRRHGAPRHFGGGARDIRSRDEDVSSAPHRRRERRPTPPLLTPLCSVLCSTPLSASLSVLLCTHLCTPLCSALHPSLRILPALLCTPRCAATGLLALAPPPAADAALGRLLAAACERAPPPCARLHDDGSDGDGGALGAEAGETMAPRIGPVRLNRHPE